MGDRSRPPTDLSLGGGAAASSSSGPGARGTASASTTLLRAHLAGHYDALAGELVLRHVPGRRVVDLGAGSPAISDWVADRAARMRVVSLADIDRCSTGAVDPVRATAPSRPPTENLPDSEAPATRSAEETSSTLHEGEEARRDPEGDEGGAPSRGAAAPPEPVLPLASGSFDVALILGVLPHLGSDAASSEAKARWLLTEAARLVEPGGVVLVDIANPRSLAGLAAGVRKTAKVIRVSGSPRGDAASSSAGTGETRITRYDTLGDLHRLAPTVLEDVEVHGIGVFAPRARVLGIPVVGALLRRLDWAARDGLFLRYFGARLLVVLRKLPSGRSRANRGVPGGLESHRGRPPSVRV